MRRRMYFVLPDFNSSRATANDLLLARIEDSQMHFLAKRGTDLKELREATVLQKSDFRHGAVLGMMLGGGGGLLIGTYILLTPPEGVQLQLVTVLIASLVGSLLGAWIASLVATAVPNSSLKRFEEEISNGKILLMVDVPKSRVEEIRDLVHRRHPEAFDHGIDPTVPAFP